MEIVGVFCALGIWAICGVFAYGYTFAFFQREFPTVAKEHYDEDRQFALEAAIMGPISLIVAVERKHTKYGLKWR